MDLSCKHTHLVLLYMCVYVYEFMCTMGILEPTEARQRNVELEYN